MPDKEFKFGDSSHVNIAVRDDGLMTITALHAGGGYTFALADSVELADGVLSWRLSTTPLPGSTPLGEPL